MIKQAKLLALISSSFLLAGCLSSGTQTGQGGSLVSGSGGAAGTQGAAPQLPQCAAPVGTAALVEEDYSVLSQKGLPSPIPLVRLMMTQSNCFRVVDRGVAMQRIQQEREFAAGGDLQANSNLGKGQVVAADYFITPSIIFQDENAGGAGGGLGAFLPGTLGAIAGGVKSQKLQAQTLMTLTSTRTGVQEAVATGSAQKNDISFFGGSGGFAGLPLGAVGGAYASTDIGKIVAAALLDSYSNLVGQVQAVNTNPAASAPAAVGSQKPYKTTTVLNMRDQPSTSGSVVKKLASGATVTPIGPTSGEWWQVADSDGSTGWVSSRFLQLAY